jgi:hypothetical protein
MGSLNSSFSALPFPLATLPSQPPPQPRISEPAQVDWSSPPLAEPPPERGAGLLGLESPGRSTRYESEAAREALLNRLLEEYRRNKAAEGGASSDGDATGCFLKASALDSNEEENEGEGEGRWAQRYEALVLGE